MDATAKQKLGRARELLISPTTANLDLCTALLASVAADVPFLESIADAEAVLAGIRHAGALLESAAEFHRQWSQTVRALCAGYEPGGGASAMALRGRLSLAG